MFHGACKQHACHSSVCGKCERSQPLQQVHGGCDELHMCTAGITSLNESYSYPSNSRKSTCCTVAFGAWCALVSAVCGCCFSLFRLAYAQRGFLRLCCVLCHWVVSLSVPFGFLLDFLPPPPFPLARLFVTQHTCCTEAVKQLIPYHALQRAGNSCLHCKNAIIAEALCNAASWTPLSSASLSLQSSADTMIKCKPGVMIAPSHPQGLSLLQRTWCLLNHSLPPASSVTLPSLQHCSCNSLQADIQCLPAAPDASTYHLTFALALWALGALIHNPWIAFCTSVAWQQALPMLPVVPLLQ
jgi:hypothetical protein